MRGVFFQLGPAGSLAVLAVLFVLLPVLEVAAIVAVGSRIGVLPTVALMAATGIVGAFLARLQGAAAVNAVRRDLAAGVLPADALLDGLLVFIGGICLVSPGFLSDLAGLGLMVPSVRHAVRVFLKARIARLLLSWR